MIRFQKLSRPIQVNNFKRCLSLAFLILGVTLQLSAQESTTPAVTGDGTLRRLKVPILMYHYVGDLPENADVYRVGLTISRDVFQAHVQYLAENRYETITLYELELALMLGIALPERPVILTFDDGYLDHFQNVFPILQSQNMTGTFFIITAFADENRQGYLTWQQIQMMAEAGMSMESHTKTHPELTNRDYDFLVYEILGSLQSLEAYLGQSTRMFAYPIGRYDEQTLRLIESTPILRAVTTENGIWHTSSNRHQVTRLRISNETGVAGLAQLLNTGR